MKAVTAISTSLQSQLQNLVWMLQFVELHKTKTDWLLNFKEKYDSIAHFGCNDGYETLALTWFLNASETIGIDKDSHSIDKAQSLQVNFQKDIENIRRTLYYTSDSPDDNKQLQEFINKFGNLAFPIFIEGDMTKTTDLSSNHFDLTYCERVLYQIICDKSKRARENILRAIEEMARVVKPGGLVVAIEPNKCTPDDKTVVKLETIFERVNLTPIEIDDPITLSENRTLYLYSKPT